MGLNGRVKKIETNADNFIENTIEIKKNYNITAETFAPSGDDSPGLDEDTVYIADIEGQGKSVVIGTISVSQGAEKGEKILYSRDANGNLKAKIHLKKDGQLLIETDGAMNFKAKGDITFENDGGKYVLQNSDGQFNVNNGNLTVDS